MTTNGTPKTDTQVLIVGAGPVGMLTALRLGQAGIDTLVIESHDKLLKTTRAMVYSPMVLPGLHELGILDLLKSNAYLNTEGVTWRSVEGKPLANLPLHSPDTDEFGGIITLGQWRLSAILLEELKKYPSVQVRYGMKLKSIDDDPSSTTIRVTTHNPKDEAALDQHLTANYILGTDGANSTTRQLLNLPFDGFSYNELRMVGTDITYDFTTHQQFTPLNFIVHPTDWAIIGYTGQDESGNAGPPTQPNPLWRVAYVEDPSLPNDHASIWSRAEAQIPKYITTSHPWKLVRAEPYMIQQRSAASGIKGRVCLAGDALHSNNPVGGLGLTGGILDAVAYGNALVRVVKGGESPDILAQCAESRLNVWRNITNEITQAHIERLKSDEADVSKARDEFFEGLNGSERDVVAGKMRKGMDQMMGDNFLVGTEKLVHVA